jgi:secondary thiamine-phosphate synthase enzyme
MVVTLFVTTRGQGLIEITGQVSGVVQNSGIEEGLATVFVQHTSASLLIQENADPSARRDLERFLDRLVPEDDGLYTHTAEGPDDMPSHVKSALTATSVAVPIVNGRLGLGTWQGIYLWEHRRRGSRRSILVHVGP